MPPRVAPLVVAWLVGLPFVAGADMGLCDSPAFLPFHAWLLAGAALACLLAVLARRPPLLTWFDAALLALEQPGSVIRVLWTREQELANAPLASAHLVDLKARLSNDGRIDRWSHELWSNGYSSRPGRAATSVLLAAPHLPYGQPAPIAINPPLAAGGGGDRNAVPGYAFENFNITNHRLLDMPLRTSAMRALACCTVYSP